MDPRDDRKKRLIPTPKARAAEGEIRRVFSRQRLRLQKEITSQDQEQLECLLRDAGAKEKEEIE